MGLRPPRPPLPLALLVAVLALRAQAGPDGIHVTIAGLRSDRGQVLCQLFASADGFPAIAAKAVARTSSPIRDAQAACDFAGIAPGHYAIAVIHDENANGRLDRNFLGIPSEGVGASRDARGHFGPPQYDDAAFDYSGGSKSMTITVQYLL